MKRMAAILLVLCVILSGCSATKVTREYAIENCETIITSVNEIAVQYGLELRETLDERYPDHQDEYRDFYITVGDKSEIYLRMDYRGSTTSKKVLQRFHLWYTITKNDAREEAINTELFVELVNAISGKSITQEFCQEFLDAPEEKYAASRYGIDKRENELIDKRQVLNFWEDWAIYYNLKTDMTEELSFYGLTKE